MPATDRHNRTVTAGEALGIVADAEGQRTLTLNRMTTATCGRCGHPPRLHTTQTSATLTVKMWIPRDHTCKGGAA